MLVPVEVECVRVERSKRPKPERDERMTLTPEDRTYVTLKDDGEMRAIDIEIGPTEAFAITSALEGHQWARPMTHDLLGQVMTALRSTLRQVLTTEHREGVYFAEKELTDRDGSLVTVSARPSDAIALALRLNAPILVNESLLADAA